MGAPPVQFVTTRDGYRIAYTISGQGYPLVVLPSFINHVQDVWTEGLSVGNLLRDAAAHYQVVNYDSRGLGMSTRGLSEDFDLGSYVIDLEAVLDELKLKRFALLGFHSFAFLAMSYALRHPERVDALILIGPPFRWHPAAWEDLPREDWEGFLADHVSRFYEHEAARRVLEMFKQWTSQSDYLISVRAWQSARSQITVADLRAPTLVLWSRGLRVEEPGVRELAQLLPNGRFALLESGLPYGAPGEAIGIIEPFLRAAAVAPAEIERAGRPAKLTARELEVLRLIAAGRSNQQIADELVISLNTVRRHVSNIFDKTGIVNRAQAGVYARDNGLV